MIAGLVLRSVLIPAIYIGTLLLAYSGQFLIGISLHSLLVAWLLSGTLNPSSRLFGPIRTRCGTGIWLTLDDGPDSTSTPAILDLLDHHGAKATFFVIGEKAETHPDLIREIHNRGHQLANHTYSHPQATFWCHGPVRTYREIARCQNVLEKITGQPVRFFRAPVGHHNVFVHPVLRHFGMELIGWDSRGFDAAPRATRASVIGKLRASTTDGSIVLAHEATPFAAGIVSEILKMTNENGWETVLSEGL